MIPPGAGCASRILRQRLRKADLMGRYGGEEFAIILPDINVEQAMNVVNDLRKTFHNISFTSEESSFSCTLSAGVSFFPLFTNKHELVNSADEALYKAKNTGRNRVVAYTELEKKPWQDGLNDESGNNV